MPEPSWTSPENGAAGGVPSPGPPQFVVPAPAVNTMLPRGAGTGGVGQVVATVVLVVDVVGVVVVDAARVVVVDAPRVVVVDAPRVVVVDAPRVVVVDAPRVVVVDAPRVVVVEPPGSS